eukprot:CCRYP_001308-RA/>CCRYP_001308-RA protein AED:0.08 eAED:0.08 QI:258/1/1/1/0.37/0.33/9/235/705
MHFIFPATTIASVSGAALLATSSSGQVAPRISLAYSPSESSNLLGAMFKARRTECLFVNAFKDQDMQVDTGILGCASFQTCVEDATSSAGGRCVTLEDVETSVESFGTAVLCTFTNGTNGYKCDGIDACVDVDQSLIGCGSCVGDESCKGIASFTTIGENSCIGVHSCLELVGSVGDNSCHYPRACSRAQAIIGSNSCVAEDYFGKPGLACYHFMGTIGDDSCHTYTACYQKKERSFSGIIGSNSCNGVYTCPLVQGFRSTYDNSCNGDNACAFIYYVCVGNNSCNGLAACYGFAPHYNIGDCQCNGEVACFLFSEGDAIAVKSPMCPTDSPSNSSTMPPTNNPSTCPTLTLTQRPSNSPTISPTKSPSGSPFKNPTKSPTASPTILPTKSPSKSPMMSPSKSPSTSPTKKLETSCPASNVHFILINSTTLKPIQMFEFQAFSNFGEEIAQGKTATQSSTYNNNVKFAASRAVDGNSLTFSHTANAGASWEVDLAGPHNISYVSIKNRYCGDTSDETGCLCRLSQATVQLLDSQRNVVKSASFDDTCGDFSPALYFDHCDDSCLVKKMKLESTTEEPIQIFEFQAYSSGTNVALLGSSTQSSLLNGNSRFKSSNAIDGNNATFSHTAASNAWLQVDLTVPLDIESIVILNRWCVDSSDPRGCLCRLSNSTLTLYAETGAHVSTHKIENTCKSPVVLQEFMSCSSM